MGECKQLPYPPGKYPPQSTEEGRIAYNKAVYLSQAGHTWRNCKKCEP